MAIASVMAIGRGATDRPLSNVVAGLADQRVRVPGALKSVGLMGSVDHRDSDLRLLSDGRVVRITQDLGPGSYACRMDAGTHKEAVGRATARLAEQPAGLVVLNRFGLSEAEGRGFRAMIAEALARDVPVPIGVSETHRAAFERFADRMATGLPPVADVVLRGCQTMTGALPKATKPDPATKSEA